MALRVGLMLDYGRPIGPTDGTNEQFLALIRLAESYGFDSVWTREAYPTEPGSDTISHMSSPLLYLAYLAGQTRMQLGTGVLLLPSFHPLRLAYDCAVLDQISEGRFILGVGVGRPWLARRFGMDPADVRDFADETLAMCHALWSGADTFEGRVVNVPDGFHPKPYTPGGPKIWLGGQIKRTAERAAKYGDAWYAGSSSTYSSILRMIRHYREALMANGKDPATATIAINRMVVISEDEGSAREIGEHHLSIAMNPYVVRDSQLAGQKSTAMSQDHIPEELAQEWYLVGTPAQVRAAFQRYVDAGVTHIQVRPYPVGVPFEVAKRTMDLLGRDVLPTLM